MDTVETTGQLDRIDINRIMELIPHRYPFLMIERVIDIVPGVKATGVKNVSINEPYFAGHFPEKPVMPGVLIIEAMAQTAAVLVVHTLGKEAEGKNSFISCRLTVPVLGSPWSPAIRFMSRLLSSGHVGTSGNLSAVQWLATRWSRKPLTPP
jgi:3-hydroxymyristoyl/3-hydroxydecanoyl-(acyl carrier protein) dehydratase